MWQCQLGATDGNIAGATILAKLPCSSAFSLHSNQSAGDDIVRSMMEALAGAEGFALAMYTLTFIGSHASINGRQRNGTP
jgi:hypothetical protein